MTPRPLQYLLVAAMIATLLLTLSCSQRAATNAQPSQLNYSSLGPPHQMGQPFPGPIPTKGDGTNPPQDYPWAITYPPPSGSPMPSTYMEENVEEMTFTPEVETQPRLSPNGKYLAFAKFSNTDPYNWVPNADIWYTMPNDNRVQVRVTDHPWIQEEPCWSPDSKHLLFTSDANGDVSIAEMTLDGKDGMVYRTPNNKFAFSVDYCLNGNRLCFASNSTYLEYMGKYGYSAWGYMAYKAVYNTDLPYIWVMNVKGGEYTQLTEGMDPRFQPSNGDSIVFTSLDNTIYNIWKMSIKGTGKTQLTFENVDCIHPCWSPDGKWIAYAANKGVAVGGVTDNGNESNSPYMSDKGQTERFTNFDIWVMRTDGTERRQITYSMAQDLYPWWGVDGYIYFSSNRLNLLQGPSDYNIWRIKVEVGSSTYHAAAPRGGSGTSSHGKSYGSRIAVLNGSGIPGLAAKAKAFLGNHGIRVTGVVGNGAQVTNSVIYYRAGHYAAAKAVADQLPGSQQPILSKKMPVKADVVLIAGAKLAGMI